MRIYLNDVTLRKIQFLAFMLGMKGKRYQASVITICVDKLTEAFTDQWKGKDFDSIIHFFYTGDLGPMAELAKAEKEEKEKKQHIL